MSSALDRILKLIEIDKLTLAKDEFGNLPGTDIETEDYWYVKARLELLRKQFSEAEISIKQAIVLNPTQSYYGGWLVHIFLCSGQFNSARKTVKECISRDPGNYWLWTQAAFIEKGYFRFKKSLSYLDTALNINPHYSWALQLRAEVLMKLGRQQEAEQTIKTMLALNPEKGENFLAHGHNAIAQGKYDEALDAYKMALMLNPNDEEARERLKRAFRLRWGFYRQIIDKFRKVVKKPIFLLLFVGLVVAMISSNGELKVRIMGNDVNLTLVVGALIFGFGALGVLADALTAKDGFGRRLFADQNLAMIRLEALAQIIGVTALLIFLFTKVMFFAMLFSACLFLGFSFSSTFRYDGQWRSILFLTLTILNTLLALLVMATFLIDFLDPEVTIWLLVIFGCLSLAQAVLFALLGGKSRFTKLWKRF